jgi:hypothetical protein
MMRFVDERRVFAPSWRWLCGLLLAVLLLGGCAEADPNTGNAQVAATGAESTATATVLVSPGPAMSAASATAGTTFTAPPAATVSSTRQPVGGTASVTAPPTGTSAATPAATTAPEPAITSSSNSGGGGGNNVVRVDNHSDGQLQIRGNVDLNHIPGPTVAPVNLASAYSSCVDCQTIAVALQINLLSRTATRITPQNGAVAVNVRCTRCVTVARAIQYNYQVDDPNSTPREISDLLNEMDRTLREIANDKGISLADAEARINAVIAQFKDLATSLNDQRQADTADNGSATPNPAGTPTTTSTPQPTGTTTPTTTVTPGTSPASPSPAPASTPAPSPAAAPSPEVTPTPAATPTIPAASAAPASPTASPSP